MMGVVDKGRVKGPVEVFAVKGGKAVKIYRGLLAQGGAARQFYSWGSGTEEDPYIIRTYADLKEIRNDLSAHYRLAADIKEESKTLNHVPIGTEDAPFTGSLDGAGYTIKLHRLFGSQDPTKPNACDGLFGVNNGTIKNLDYLAVVHSDSALENCQHFGMLTGVNHGTIHNCRVVAGWQHTNTSPFGVVAGRNESDGTIKNVECRALFFSAPVGKLGLLAGVNAGLIEDCYTDIQGISQKPENEVGYAVHTLEATGYLDGVNTLVTREKYPNETPFDFWVNKEEGGRWYTRAIKTGSNSKYFYCQIPTWGSSENTYWKMYVNTNPDAYKDGLTRAFFLKTFRGKTVDQMWLKMPWR